jgi:hypothetical protein
MCSKWRSGPANSDSDAKMYPTQTNGCGMITTGFSNQFAALMALEALRGDKMKFRRLH